MERRRQTLSLEGLAVGSASAVLTPPSHGAIPSWCFVVWPRGEVSRACGLRELSYSLLLLAWEKKLRKWNAFFLLWQYQVTVTLQPKLSEHDHRACYILLSYSNTYTTQKFKHLGFLTTCNLCLLIISWIYNVTFIYLCTSISLYSFQRKLSQHPTGIRYHNSPNSKRGPRVSSAPSVPSSLQFEKSLLKRD